MRRVQMMHGVNEGSRGTRIAQIAPPWYPIPPRGYGGIERVIHDVTEGLVEAGHEVILFAPAGSDTSACLIETMPSGLGLDMPESEKTAYFIANGRRAYNIARELKVDLIHDHTDFSPDPGFPQPVLRTIHGPAVAYHVAMYQAMSGRGDQFIAISHRQREIFELAVRDMFGPEGRLRFAGVIHNPINVGATPFYPRAAKDDYVAFLGRCHWEKDPVGAIRVAMAAGVPMKMALRITAQERPYFDEVVKPALAAAGSLVEFIGEVGGIAKSELVGRARAVVFSSPWEEPFGLVQIEAGAHGTPVVALRRGAAPEIVHEGVSGYLGNDLDELARLLPAAMELDPLACRAQVAANFDRSIIARQHAEIYERTLTGATYASAASVASLLQSSV